MFGIGESADSVRASEGIRSPWPRLGRRSVEDEDDSCCGSGEMSAAREDTAGAGKADDGAPKRPSA